MKKISDAAFAELVRGFVQAADEDVDDALREQIALKATIVFLKSIPIPDNLLKPLVDLFNHQRTARARRDHGNAHKPAGEVDSLARAAAWVTFLREGGTMTVKEAIRSISSDSGIKEKQIKEFRDEINRGRATEIAVLQYQTWLDSIRRQWPHRPESPLPKNVK